MSKHYPTTMQPDDPNRQRPPRQRAGSPPRGEQRPVTLAELHIHAHSELWRVSWLQAKIGNPNARLAAAQPDPSDEWLNLKLWAVDRVSHKANYWTAWNPTARRFTSRGDTRALASLRPDLHQTLAAAMTLLSAELNAGAALMDVPLIHAARSVSDALTVGFDPVCESLLSAPGIIATPENAGQIKYLTGMLRRERGVDFAVIGEDILGVEVRKVVRK